MNNRAPTMPHLQRLRRRWRDPCGNCHHTKRPPLGPPASTWTAQPYLDRPRRRLRRSNWRDGVHPGKRGPTGGTRSKQGAGAGTGAGSRGPPRRPAPQGPCRAAPGRRRASCSRQAAWRRTPAWRRAGQDGACPPGGRPPAPAPVRVGTKCPRSAQTAPAPPAAVGRALESCGFSIGPRGCRRPLCRTRTPPRAPGPTPHTNQKNPKRLEYVSESSRKVLMHLKVRGAS
ncbi:hypothetical protein SAMN04487766_11613 [Actinomyces ruminicola]|uniref:Uncharacterized protein n=1 Tax=Actinomyces ruminicola TaxID=332524 RepID=A0A1G9Z811_9ACTO|nr:hypothetical protein SAMN04487766_11613 [Actinomyces ruminicola]